MRCNNKHILEGSSEAEKLTEEVLSYVHDEIKSTTTKTLY